MGSNPVSRRKLLDVRLGREAGLLLSPNPSRWGTKHTGGQPQPTVGLRSSRPKGLHHQQGLVLT